MKFKSLLGQLRSKYFLFAPLIRSVQYMIKLLWRSSKRGAGEPSGKQAIKENRSEVCIRVSNPNTLQLPKHLHGPQTNFDIEIAVRGDCVDIGAFSGAGYVGREDLDRIITDVCKTALGV